jgi:hypothetical protein
MTMLATMPVASQAARRTSSVRGMMKLPPSFDGAKGALLGATLRRELVTPILLLAFLLVLDVLVLLGRSHDSRDGRDWQPRGSPSRGPSAVAPI